MKLQNRLSFLMKAFGFKIKTFSNKAEFRQKIAAVESSFTVTGVVNFMACNNATCSPPKDVEFAIKISDKVAGQVITSNKNSGNDQMYQKQRGLLKFFLISLACRICRGSYSLCLPNDPNDSRFFLAGIRKQEQVCF